MYSIILTLSTISCVYINDCLIDISRFSISYSYKHLLLFVCYELFLCAKEIFLLNTSVGIYGKRPHASKSYNKSCGKTKDMLASEFQLLLLLVESNK